MSKLEVILQNYGNLNYRLAQGNGKKTQNELYLVTIKEIKDLFLEIIGENDAGPIGTLSPTDVTYAHKHGVWNGRLQVRAELRQKVADL